MLNITKEVATGIKLQSYKDAKGNYCFKEEIEKFKDLPLQEIIKNPPEFTFSVSDKPSLLLFCNNHRE